MSLESILHKQHLLTHNKNPLKIYLKKLWIAEHRGLKSVFEDETFVEIRLNPSLQIVDGSGLAVPILLVVSRKTRRQASPLRGPMLRRFLLIGDDRDALLRRLWSGAIGKQRTQPRHDGDVEGFRENWNFFKIKNWWTKYDLHFCSLFLQL